MPDNPLPGSRTRPRFLKWVVLLLAILILAAVFLHSEIRRFDWDRFLATLADLHWGWLLLSVALVLATYAGRALRWAVLMAPVKPRPSMRNLLSATAIGFAAITLLGRPGELVRPYLIAMKERVPLSSQLAALLLERICDLLMALLMFGAALSQIDRSAVTVGPALNWVFTMGGRLAALFAFLSLLVLLLIRHLSEKMRQRLLDALRFLPEGRYRQAERLVNAFVQGVEATRSWRALLLLTAYTVVEWILILACARAVLSAFGAVAQFGWVDVLIFMGFVAFGAVIQIPGVGGGVQVVSVLVLTELFRVSLEAATSMAMVFWIITFIVIVPPGLALALREGLSWSKIKQMGQETDA